MLYRIGEVAEFFGITKEGVRHYERMGIIASERDAQTGYRYYQRSEITRLKQVRFYEELGFSLKEAKALVIEKDYDQMCAAVDVKMEELQRRAEEIAAAIQELQWQKDVMKRFDQGVIEVCTMPEGYFLQRVQGEASGKDEEERLRIALARNREKAWTQAMPPVRLMGLHYKQDLTPVYDVLGSFIEAQQAQRLGLPLEGTVVLKECRCVRSTVHARLGEKPDISHILLWMRERGLRLCGDIYGSLMSTYRAEDGSRWGIHDFYLPIEEICG